MVQCVDARDFIDQITQIETVFVGFQQSFQTDTLLTLMDGQPGKNAGPDAPANFVESGTPIHVDDYSGFDRVPVPRADFPKQADARQRHKPDVRSHSRRRGDQ